MSNKLVSKVSAQKKGGGGGGELIKEELLVGYLRPYHVENNCSLQISEIKLRKACLVGWDKYVFKFQYPPPQSNGSTQSWGFLREFQKIGK